MIQKIIFMDKLKSGGITNGGFSTTLNSSIFFLSTPALSLIWEQDTKKRDESINSDKITFITNSYLFFSPC